MLTIPQPLHDQSCTSQEGENWIQCHQLTCVSLKNISILGFKSIPIPFVVNVYGLFSVSQSSPWHFHPNDHDKDVVPASTPPGVGPEASCSMLGASTLGQADVLQSILECPRVGSWIGPTNARIAADQWDGFKGKGRNYVSMYRPQMVKIYFGAATKRFVFNFFLIRRRISLHHRPRGSLQTCLGLELMQSENKMKPTNQNAHTYDEEPRNHSYERRERKCKVWSGKWKVWSVKCGM